MVPNLHPGTHYPIYRYSDYLEHDDQRLYWNKTWPIIRHKSRFVMTSRRGSSDVADSEFSSHILCFCFFAVVVVVLDDDDDIFKTFGSPCKQIIGLPAD